MIEHTDRAPAPARPARRIARGPDRGAPRSVGWPVGRLVARLAVVVSGALAAVPQAATAGDVLVELFTSQGCSSCPPADRILGTMAGREGVVALSFHVDYWDYLGWRDTFADSRYSLRQFSYRDTWEARVVYTPQMVVGGDRPVQGNRIDAVETAIAEARRAGDRGAITIEDGAMLIARLDGLPGDAVIWAARYQRSAEVAIERGENAGRRLVYHNVVRELSRLGQAGRLLDRALTLPVPAPGEGVAVWAQADEGFGRVLAVVSYEAPGDLGG